MNNNNFNISRKTALTLAVIIFGAVLLNWALTHTYAAGKFLSGIGSLLTPFLLGGGIAFVFNVPMRALEKHLFPKSAKLQSIRRPLAWLLTLILLLLACSLVVMVVIPQMITTLSTISQQAMQAVKNAGQYLETIPPEVLRFFPDLEQTLQDLGLNISTISDKAAQMLQNLGSLFASGFNILGSIISAFTTLFIGFFFSIYLLFGKEKLAEQGKQVLYTLLPTPKADKAVEVLRLTDRTFANFITGQCLEACILGMMFFVAMLLLRLPYATLTAVLIGVTSLVPIFGAFVGCIISALFIALNDPMQAVIFLVMFLVLQQIEGNLIYPKVVGGSVGLPAIWVLVAITLGGNLLGLLGMLVFIPLCSVAYALFSSFVRQKLKADNIPPEKWQN